MAEDYSLVPISSLTELDSATDATLAPVLKNGTPYKAPLSKLKPYFKGDPGANLLTINLAAFSSLPKTITNAAITAQHVVVEAVLGTPSAQTGDWTVTTAAGSLTISGSISGSTTLTLVLGVSGATISG